MNESRTVASPNTFDRSTAMSISELGSLGEFIASIAVVLSIAFLAFQMRQNTKALKVSAYADFVSRQMQILDIETRNAGLLARVHSNTDVSAPEYAILVARMSGVLRNGDALFYQRQQGLLDASRWESVLTLIAGVVSESDLNRSIWRKFQNRYVPEYQLAINNRMSETEGKSRGAV